MIITLIITFFVVLSATVTIVILWHWYKFQRLRILYIDFLPSATPAQRDETESRVKHTLKEFNMPITTAHTVAYHGAYRLYIQYYTNRKDQKFQLALHETLKNAHATNHGIHS